MLPDLSQKANEEFDIALAAMMFSVMPREQLSALAVIQQQTVKWLQKEGYIEKRFKAQELCAEMTEEMMKWTREEIIKVSDLMDKEEGK